MTSNLNLVEYLGKNPYQILYPERFVVYVGESEDGEGIIHVYYYKPERGEPSLLDEAQIERVQQINGVYDPEIGAEALQLLEFNLLGYPNEILKKIVLDATSESRQLQLRLLNRDIQDVYDTFVRYPEVWVCGDNGFGQLGLGDTQNRNLLTQLKSIPYKAKVVRFGRYHMAVVTVNGQVWTSGLNQYGQLGLGDTQNRSTPARVPFPRDFAFEDGDDYIVDAFCCTLSI